MDEMQKAIARPASATVAMFSALRRFPIFSKAFKHLYDLEQEIHEFLRTQIREYTKKFEVEGLADTKVAVPFVGAYLRAKQASNGKVNDGSILFSYRPFEFAREFCDASFADNVSFAVPTSILAQIFPEPNRFKPERFIDKNGQLLKVEELIPFSTGKRICVGESLARMELFLSNANFFHTFKFRAVDPLNPPTSEKVPGFAVYTKPYKVRLELRHSSENSPMQNSY